ncbi:MAG TPA: hypothetical protein VE033_06450 [Acetobacteraceae bacterium]|nr:hypothetical protein [Acetobacteraceae bacterium]
MSFRAVELLLAERGVVLSCESLRRWRLKFGGGVAACLRRRRTRPGDAWDLDEVVLRMNCVPH